MPHIPVEMKMDERSKHRVSIKDHLLKEDVQERILHYIQKGRAEATVTISRAAELFNFSENKLRDWEEHRFLQPLRPTGPKGRRLYMPGELDKLAIIRELIDAGYAPSDIPPDIDTIWHAIRSASGFSTNQGLPEHYLATKNKIDDIPIDQRIDQGRADLFWRYYVSHALRLSLMLICEDIPNTTAGLLLPLEPSADISAIRSVEDISKLGESLVGWLGQSRSSHTLLTTKPSFQYSTDFRIQPLRVMKAGVIQEDNVQDPTLIVVRRDAKALTLSVEVVETIRRLLRPLYEKVSCSRVSFGPGMRDVLDSATDLDSHMHNEDAILTAMADMIVHLGGQTPEGQPRWHFCCILLPNYPPSVLSLQQRSLVVRAQSELAPHKLGVTTLSPQGSAIGLSIRAFQSGRIIYFPDIAEADTTIALRHLEEPIRSALAVPVEGFDSASIAVIYVVSETTHAFSEGDQRLLRMIGQMIGELLETYHSRLLATEKLRDLILSPGIVDTSFQEFLSENEFVEDIESLLTHVHSRAEYHEKDVVSFIAIDIDNQSSLANKYGDRMARDLSKTVGLRIQSQLNAFKDDAESHLYRAYADKYYIFSKGMQLEQAQAKAERLRQVLAGPYQIDPLRAPTGQPTLPENMVTLSNITVRLGVASYFYSKLEEILQRCSAESAVVEARIQIVRFLDEALVLGKREGGNVVISWDPHTRGFVRCSPLR